MSNIDWSKAPDGATHWDPVDRNHLQQLANVSLVWNIAMGWVSHQGQYPNDLSLCDRLVKRPPQEPKMAWSGEGLPPVGTVCEINGTVLQELRGEQSTWREVDIIAHTNFGGADVAVGRDIEKATLGWGTARAFRPIRTPEQIAAEEREKAIKAMLDLRSVGAGVNEFARQLYDAGYRKQEQPK